MKVTTRRDGTTVPSVTTRWDGNYDETTRLDDVTERLCQPIIRRHDGTHGRHDGRDDTMRRGDETTRRRDDCDQAFRTVRDNSSPPIRRRPSRCSRFVAGRFDAGTISLRPIHRQNKFMDFQIRWVRKCNLLLTKVLHCTVLHGRIMIFGCSYIPAPSLKIKKGFNKIKETMVLG